MKLGPESIGKRVLVGITYMEGFDVRCCKQYHSMVFEFDDAQVFFRRDNGKQFSVPNEFDLNDAPDDKLFVLKSTGEQVTNVYATSAFTTNAEENDSYIAETMERK